MNLTQEQRRIAVNAYLAQIDYWHEHVLDFPEYHDAEFVAWVQSQVSGLEYLVKYIQSGGEL